MNVSTPDFNAYMRSLRQFMSTSPDLADYDFDGSALSFLGRVLAYDATNQGYMNAMMFNELHSTAEMRENIGTLVQFMAYTPESAKSAYCIVDIIVSPANLNGAPNRLNLEDTVRFSVTSDGQAFTAVPSERYTSEPLTGGQYVFRDVKLVQGKRIIQTFDVSSHGIAAYTIPHKNVDIETLKVYTTPSETNLAVTEYARYKDAYDLGKDLNLYYVELGGSDQYVIELGDGVLSNKPDVGSVLYAKYLITEGSVANGMSQINPTMSISGYTNIKVTSKGALTGGRLPEQPQSIKRNAKLKAWTGGVAVSPEDYENIIMTVPGVEDVICWGGETNVPPQNGVMFASVIDTDHNFNTPEALKTEIINTTAKHHLGSIKLSIVDPNIMYIDVVSKVTYDTSISSATPEEIEKAVYDNITAFSEDMGRFDAVFDMSQFSTAINNSSPAINGNITDVRYRKMFSPIALVTGTYFIKFNKELEPGSVTVSGFDMDGGDINSLRMRDDNGTMILESVVNGEWTYDRDVGTVDYDTGYVSLTSVTFTGSDPDGVRITADSQTIDRNITNRQGVYLTIGDVDVTASVRR